MIGWGAYARSILSGFRSPFVSLSSPSRQPLTAYRLLGDDLVVTQQKAPAVAGALVGR